MNGKTKLLAVVAGIVILAVETWWFSAPRTSDFKCLFGAAVALPAGAVCALATVVAMFQRERYGWVTLFMTLLFLPFLWQWPLLVNVKLHERELIAYIRSGTDQPAKIGPFNFLYANSKRHCAITAELSSGLEGLWFEVPGELPVYGMCPSRLNSRWVFAAEE